MNSETPEGSKAAAETDTSEGAARVPSEGMSVAAAGATKADDIAADGTAEPSKSAAGADQPLQAQRESADPNKLQTAMEKLVGRIAEARSRGASAPSRPPLHASRYALSDDPAADLLAAEAMSGAASEDSAEERPPRTDRHFAALELRMRQIAELAGAPLAEDISADIAALRSKMDRLSRADGTLSNRMETIQRQLSNLRESMDTSSTPVVDRLVEMETRLDDIGEALANRHLSVEARSAVEHSCSHILGAIARIEGVARQAVLPEGAWDQIASVRRRIERLPTVDNMAGLERRIREVSDQIGEAAHRNDRSEDMANLEQHLSEIGAATRAAVQEMRERPAYDPTDVRTLLQRIETWRGEQASSDSPVVSRKLDSISRQVDELSKSGHLVALAKIQENLSELTGIVSKQHANLSGLDLAGLQSRLTKICDELSSVQGGRRSAADAAPSMPSEPRSASDSVPLVSATFSDPHGDDEDRELAKRLAVRFAPQSEPRRETPARQEPASEDASGAFDALQDALESLVGQIPFVERTSELEGQSRTPQQDRSVPPRPPVPQREAAKQPTAPRPSGGDDPGQRYAALRRELPTRRPTDSAGPEVSAAPLAGQPKAPEKNSLTPTADSQTAQGHATYADAAHRIGRSSTWRKAKVAVVAANTPKY